LQGVQVTALDPNAAMFPYARDAAAAAGMLADQLQLVQGKSEAMPFEDGTFDYVISTITLCSVALPALALAQIQRVLRPGGRLLFIEHVRASESDPLLRGLQQVLNPLQTALADGCHLNRETGVLIANSGFASVDSMYFQLDGGSLISPHVSGTAIAM
jgi:SAM-dependent methyltransferase